MAGQNMFDGLYAGFKQQQKETEISQASEYGPSLNE